MPYSNIIKKSLAPNEKVKKSFSLSPTYLRIKLTASLIKWLVLVALIVLVLTFLQNNLDLSLFTNNSNTTTGLGSGLDSAGSIRFDDNLKNLEGRFNGANLFIIALLIYIFFITPLIFFYSFFYLRISNEYILSDTRIIVKKGWLSTKTLSARYSRITDVKVSQSFIDRILKLGTIKVNTAGGEDYEIILSHVANPYKLKKVLHILKEEYLKKTSQRGDSYVEEH